MLTTASREEPGLQVRLVDLVYAVSEAMDSMCPEVVGHQRRVAFIVHAIARQIGLAGADHRDVVLAAALHDCGAFSLREKLSLLDFETRLPHKHADAGYRLLKIVPDFERAAVLVRYHHVVWAYGRGEAWLGGRAPLGSQIIHLADRVSVLIDPADEPLSQARVIRRKIAARAGAFFNPEVVQAFEEAAAAADFWSEAEHPGALYGEEMFGDALVAEADVMNLASIFYRFVDFRSHFTATHTSGVVAVVQHLAGLCGLDEATTRKLTIAAAMHDLGKLSVPAEILEKAGPLTDAEWEVMHRHPSCGFEVLGKMPALREINTWANYHHEKLSGRGYPFHLSAERIPFESRIVSVADVFTALTEDRPYRRGLGRPEVAAILRTMVDDGSLDPALVEMAARHGEAVGEARRSAQARAVEHYRDFCTPAAGEEPRPSIAATA
jgi:HD-GYP domain-containing protein (c-di-GMP phosphodiesterase class II)